MKIRSIILATSLLSSSVFASNINLDYVEAGYTKFAVDDNEFSAKGFGLKFNKSITDNVIIKGSYLLTSDSSEQSRTEEYLGYEYDTPYSEETDITQLYLGIGYLFNLDGNIVELAPYFGKLKAEYTETFTGVDYSQESIGTYTESDRDSGDLDVYGIEANYHFAFNDTIDMLLGLGYERLDHDYDPESKVFYQIQLNYNITENFTLNFAHRNVKEYKNTGLNIRYNF